MKSPTIFKVKRVKKNQINLLKDSGSKTKKPITKKYQDGRFSFMDKMFKNG